MIQLQGITKSFGSLQVLRGIDLNIDKGEIVSIVGPSGAGKTTLLQIMGTLDAPDSGTITIDGTLVSRMKEKELSAFRNKHIGFVFQFHQLYQNSRHWKRDDTCIYCRCGAERGYCICAGIIGVYGPD